MISEQKPKLSSKQYKLAKTRILERISFYLAVCQYTDEKKALEILKSYYYKKAESASKFLRRLSKSNLGCTLFRKAFVSGLKSDTWVSTIKRNDRDALVYDITKCLYKDLCDEYKCPDLCMLFCDGDWLMFGEMKKLKFSRRYTLGQGDEVCDFHFDRSGQ